MLSGHSSQTTWRDFLRMYISSSDRHQELAQNAGLNSVTLARWCSLENKTKPHKKLLERVAQALPEEDRTRFVSLVQQESPDFFPFFEPQKDSVSIEDIPEEIPGEFIYRSLRAVSHTHRTHAFSTLAQLVIQQLTLHIFQNVTPGMALLLLTPPKEHAKVKSLYTPLQPIGVWPASLIHFPVFLGIESALSMALVRHEACVFNQSLFPDEPLLKDIKSMLVIALRKFGCVGGCFVLLSPEAGYFQHPKRQKLIEKYSYILALGLEEFFDPENVQLAAFPSFSSQLELEHRFPFAQRLERHQRESSKGSWRTVPGLFDIERETIQELEADLLITEQSTSQEEHA